MNRGLRSMVSPFKITDEGGFLTVEARFKQGVIGFFMFKDRFLRQRLGC